MWDMVFARSKITAQGQISVPAEVRRKLGVRPGSVLEWHEEGEKVVVSRAGRHTSEDIHRALFPKRPPKARRLDELKAGIRAYVKARSARR
jgi:antitoxin PrlF